MAKDFTPNTDTARSSGQTTTNQQSGSEPVDTPSQIATLQKRIGGLQSTIAKGGSVESILESVANLNKAQSDLAELQSKLANEEFALIQDKWLRAFDSLQKRTPNVKRVLYELESVTLDDGSTTTKSSLHFNDQITKLVGKRSSGSGGGGGRSKTYRHTDGTTITSKDLFGKLQSDNPDVVRMLGGTEHASAYARIIESAQKRGYLSDWKESE